MLLRRAARAASRAASSTLQRHGGVASCALGHVSSPLLVTGASRPGCIAIYREVSTITKSSTSKPEVGDDGALHQEFVGGSANPPVGELLELVEQSRKEGDTERELKHSLELYDVLKRRSQQDADTFEVAFSIARIYDDQLEDGAATTRYYEEALAILEAISTEATAWGVYMRVTTLGALAICCEHRGQPDEADKYFGDAIGAYEEHCEQASGSTTGEEDISDEDISLLTDLNATAAMVHYHYAGNLLAQERWDEVRTVTKIALELAENSSMATEDLEQLQQCIHELWAELE